MSNLMRSVVKSNIFVLYKANRITYCVSGYTWEAHCNTHWQLSMHSSKVHFEYKKTRCTLRLLPIGGALARVLLVGCSW